MTLPEGWTEVALGDIASVNSGQSPPSSIVNNDGRGIPFFQGCAEFGEIHPHPQKWIERPLRIAETGDILLSVRAPVGAVNIADQRCCIGRGIAAITCCDDFTQRYVWHYMPIFELEMRRHSKGSTFNAINRDEILEYRLAIPTELDEIRRITEVLDSADNSIAIQRRLIGKLELMRGGLLNDFLSYGIDEHGTLRSPETHNFVESPVGLIPETWNVLRGDQLFTCGSGHAPVEIDLSDDGTALFLKASDLSRPENRNVVITSKLRYYPENQNTRINSFPENSIVFAKRGEAIRQNRVRRVGCTVSVDSNLMVLECYNVNPQFFVELLTHMNIETLLESSTLPQINNKHLYPKLFAIPPREEQDYIIERTNSIRDRIDSEIALLDKYSTIKHGLLQDLLTGRVRVPTPAPDSVEVAA